MGIFDSIKKSAQQAAAGAASTGAAAGATATSAEEAAVSELFGAGGSQLTGLLGKLNVGGLDDIAKSWVGKGENKAISVDQIKAVLSSDQIAAVAKKLGLSQEQAAAKIAEVLPGLIDKLTPDGLVPDPDALAAKVTGLFNK